MKINVLFCRVCVAVCVPAVLVLSGCAKSKFQDPSPEQIRMFLDGQEIVTADASLPILADDISLFKVADIVAEPKGEHASAIVTFEYRHDGRTYKVEGVVSYERSLADPFKSPYFEVNELN